MMPLSDQPQGDSATMEPAVEPIPPRYWWLKRMIMVAGILFVALLALRLGWGWEANRRLQAEIDKIIAAGEPIYPEDFDPKEEIPDDQNTARLLIGAEEAVNLTSEQLEVLQKVTAGPDRIRARLDENRGIVDDNPEVFRLLRHARSLPSTDWGLRIRTPAIETSLPVLSGQRNLVKLIYLAAWHHHIAGNDSEAIETVRDGLAQSRSLSQYPTLIPQLVSWASGAITIRVLEDIFASLSIVPEEVAPGEVRRGVSESQVRNLIAELLDERGAREGMRRAMLAERMFQVDIHKEVMHGNSARSAMCGWGGGPFSVSNFAWRHVLRPALTLDVVGALRDTTPLVEAAEAASFSEVPRVEEDSTGASGLGSHLQPFRGAMLASLDRAFVLYFRLLVKRRVAAAALAIRLYEVDHGRRPATLTELVPEYLPQIPQDLFTEDGQALRYLPQAAHPVVYSIGDDGLDEQGNSDNYADVTFFLDGWREENVGDNQEDVNDEEGKADEDESGEEEP